MFPLPYMLIGAAVMAIVSFLAGVKVESDHRDAQLLVQERAVADQYKKDMTRQRELLDARGSELALARAARDADRMNFIQEVRNAKKPLTACPKKTVVRQEEVPSRPVPVPVEPTRVADVPDSGVLTDEFVRLWNKGQRNGLPAVAVDPPGTAGGSEGPNSVTAEEVLENHGENSALCNEFRTKLRQWKKVASDNGWIGEHK